MLAACAGTPEPRVAKAPPAPKGVKIGQPYQVMGVWYYPKDDRGYDEVGIASWYGPGFHGKSTANGEPYDMDGITAAHKTLPLPSFVEVTNLQNGRRQLVRVNDRGPFVSDRVIDLSRRTAQLLGVDRAGTAKVRVRRVYPSVREIAAIMPGGRTAPVMVAAAAPAPPPRLTVVNRTPRAIPQPIVAPAESVVRTVALPDFGAPAVPVAPPPSALETTMFVQVAAVSDEARASTLAGSLAAIGATSVERTPAGLFRVRVGPFATPDAAAGALAQVQAAGYSDARVVGASIS